MPFDSNALSSLLRRKSFFRAKELQSLNLHPQTIKRLCSRGMLISVGKGIYTSPEAEPGEHHSLAEASEKVPKGVVCLLSALNFFSIGSHLPHEVWLSLPFGHTTPSIQYPPLRIVHISKSLFTNGVEIHQIEGSSVSITNPARTIVDCFKFRNKIGIDVAVEALREALRKGVCTPGDIGAFATVFRMETIIKPYIEAIET